MRTQHNDYDMNILIVFVYKLLAHFIDIYNFFLQLLRRIDVGFKHVFVKKNICIENHKRARICI